MNPAERMALKTNWCPEDVARWMNPRTVAALAVDTPGRATHDGVWLTGLYAYGGPPAALFVVRTYQPTSKPRNERRAGDYARGGSFVTDRPVVVGEALTLW